MPLHSTITARRPASEASSGKGSGSERDHSAPPLEPDTVTVVGQLGMDELDGRLTQTLQRVAADHATSAAAHQAERVMLVDDEYEALADAGLGALVLVRLGTIEQQFGVAIVGRAPDTQISSRYISVLQMLAAQTALALHRARLERERAQKEAALQKRKDALEAVQADLEARVEERTDRLRQYTKRLKILREIDRAILAAQSPSEIAEAALERLREFVAFTRASVLLFHWEREVFEILAIHQTRGAMRLEQGATFPIDTIPIPDALYEGEPDIVDDLRTAPSTKITERLKKDENIRSLVSFPLFIEGDLIGMVNFGADEPGIYSGQWKHIIREVADQLSIAIRQANLTEQVRRYSQQLEARVQERTEELESFTYSVSHDLRTPLRAVDGFSRMLMDRYAEDLDAEGQRLVQVIHENTQKMGQLIDGLLALSRLGRRTMQRRSVDVEQLAREAFDEARQGAEDPPAREDDGTSDARDVSFTVEQLPKAHADRAMLQRVFVNLLSNAIKFTRDEPDPQITVSAHENEEGATVYVVRDNGVGFNMDYQDKLFGVFQRLHDEDAFEGRGIGLSIAERTIRRHNGQIWAEGTEGEGAAFYFTLGSESPAP